jgi:radical SAM protein with 4Fe4S-binding SPASM domain
VTPPSIAKGECIHPISPETFTVVRDGKVLLLNPKTPDWVVVNETAGHILGLFDGTKTINDIVEELRQNGFDFDPDTISELVLECYEKGLLLTEEPSGKPDVEDKINEEKYLTPKPLHSIHLKLTNNCNLACVYCYAESALCTSSPTLSLDELIKIADDARELSEHVDFTLSGGEPLMHPNALEFAEYVRNKKHRVALLTNGSLINKKNVKKISQLFSLIKISLDGSSEEINSMTRGRNTSKAAVKAFKLLNEQNANVIMNMTVTKTNLSDIGNMANMYGEQLNFQPLFKAGMAKDENDNAITGDEYYEALASADGVNPLSKIGEIITQYRGNGISKCPLADGDISISETGDVYPCQMLYEEEFKGGNIKEKSLLDIYKNSNAFKPLRKLHVENLEGCSSCPIRRLCGGSCRARAYLETGNISVSGQFCDFERRAIIDGIFNCSEFEKTSS